MNQCHFIPPYLLERIGASDIDAEVARYGHATLAVDEELRASRIATPPLPQGAIAPRSETGEDAWTVYTADNGTRLPGTPVRAEGEEPSGDEAVDEAYVGVEATLDLFRTMLGRDSYDGRGAPVTATVHYERNYDNAFWDGRQLVFGDGDGRVFERFTKPIDVLGHEFTHAVTQYTAGLEYRDQPGALNESMSDVFGSCVKQRVLGQSVAEADWLIGEGIFRPSIHGRALRSMAQPGTAYDDPVLGKDPQVGSMSDYVHTSSDNGGVHLNSGIPNRAFYLAATGLGGNSWEVAGPIWYAALTSGIDAHTDFARFAGATVEAARQVSAQAASVVASAWEQVGVQAAVPAGVPGGGGAPDAPGVPGSPGSGGSSGSGDTPGSGDAPGGSGAPDSGGASGSDEAPCSGSGGSGGRDTVSVRRSGGFAGREVSGEVVLGDDPRTPEVETLVARIDLRAVAADEPQPDRFVYVFCVLGEEVTVAEQALTPELSRLATIVLEG
jgi:hypothetical protein